MFVLRIDAEFFNNMIFGIIQDSSVSNTSDHPHFGEEGNLVQSWLHVHLYVLWKKLEEKVGSVAKVWRLGVPGKCWLHLQAGSTFARNQ